MSTTEPSDQNNQPTLKTVGYDSLLEDVVGLNIKGLKSIWVLTLTPSKYFKAAKHPEWENQFTPSFRVWFGIMAITAALKFLWAGDSTPMLEAYSGMMSQLADQIEASLVSQNKTIDFSEFNPKDAANVLLKWMFIIMPFAYMILTVGLAFIYRAWGNKLNFVVRLRYLFAIVIVGNFVSLLTIPFLRYLPLEHMQVYSWVGMLVMFGLYFMTAYRGAYAHLNKSGRFWRSILVTILLAITMLLATAIAMIIAFFPTISSTFPSPT